MSEARSPPETAGRQRPRQPLRRPAEATSGGREPSVVPGHVRLGAQNREGRPRSASCDASRERARYGCTLSFRVASVGQTHRALSPPKGRKASRRCKNASWKEAPHLSDKRVAASSRRTGARVNDFPQRLPVARDHELRFVTLSDTMVGVLGSHLEDPHRSRGHEVLRLAGQARRR